MSEFLSNSEYSGYYKYLQYIRHYPMLSAEEEQKLANDVFHNQSKVSAEKLVVSHLKLVAKIAYTMRGYGLVLMDLIGEGTVGLMHAVKKFNPKLGSRFASYATWWIKAYMKEYVIKTWSLVKIGTTAAQKKLFFHLKKLKAKILSTHGYVSENLSNQDCKTIAKELAVSSVEVRSMDVRLNSDYSLDYSYDDASDSKSLVYNIPDQGQDVELAVSSKEIQKKQKLLLGRALVSLDDRQRDIIQSRHCKEKPDSLAVLGTKYKISQERVRQIESSALSKIKEYCTENLI